MIKCQDSILGTNADEEVTIIISEISQRNFTCKVCIDDHQHFFITAFKKTHNR